MTKGMILAAGLGERLKPLTLWLPKPLLPVANVPVMRQGIRRLNAAGITEICVNVSYRADDIQHQFGNGSGDGVRLHWSVEDQLWGTAGGLKRVERILRDDTVVIIAGDAMLDVDLEPLIEAHREKKAAATLGTLRVEDPSQYGVVVSDSNGRIASFQEKPAPGTQISNEANTGIYIFEPVIFELIPPETFFDFAKDVFPQMLTNNIPMYAQPINGYWTDIGSPKAYLDANMHFLQGLIHAPGDGDCVNGSIIGRDAQIEGVRLTECVVGPEALLPAGTSLKNCVVWPRTVLPAPVSAERSVVTPNGICRLNGKQCELGARHDHGRIPSPSTGEG